MDAVQLHEKILVAADTYKRISDNLAQREHATWYALGAKHALGRIAMEIRIAASKDGIYDYEKCHELEKEMERRLDSIDTGS
jgi:hypothetical protein